MYLNNGAAQASDIGGQVAVQHPKGDGQMGMVPVQGQPNLIFQATQQQYLPKLPQASSPTSGSVAPVHPVPAANFPNAASDVQQNRASSRHS